MLTRAGIAVIDALSSGRDATPADLADETGYSQAHMYEVLDELRTAGLLDEARGPNNLRRVQLATHPVIEAYRTLRSTLSHIPWAEILTPANLRVCWFLDEPRRLAEIADRLDVTRQAVHNAISPLKHRAMLAPAGPEYALHDELSPLLAFAEAVVTAEHRSRTRTIAPSATVEWCDPKRALVRIQTAADTDALQRASAWRRTGLAKYGDYGLQFFLASEPAFWYAPDEELDPADVVCHTLLLESGPRRVSYSMLVIETCDIHQETLTDLATWYDLEPVVTAMYRALREGFEGSAEVPVDLPTESAYQALKNQYGVS